MGVALKAGAHFIAERAEMSTHQVPALSFGGQAWWSRHTCFQEALRGSNFLDFVDDSVSPMGDDGVGVGVGGTEAVKRGLEVWEDCLEGSGEGIGQCGFALVVE
jgi:hypothetical protein